MNRLTLVITVYNSEKFLERCLDSVVKQKQLDRVMIVDDGSTDNSALICKKYLQYGFEYYFKKNGGIASARNFALDKVKTEWVTFLDDDDELLPDAMKKILSKIDSPQNIIGFNQWRHYYTSNKTVRKYYNRPGFYTLENLPKQFQMVWNKMYRTEFLNDNNLRFDEDMRYSSDEIFNLKCLLKNRKIQWCEPCTILRHFDNSKSIVHTVRPEDIRTLDRKLCELKDSLEGQDKITLERLIKKHRLSAKYKKYTKI